MLSSRADILVIDDQLDNLRTLSEILLRKGYRVRQATNGKTALRTALSQPPDLILLDIRMPHMDGYAVCAALKESSQTREIPVIFLSALGEVTDKVKAFDMGGVDYVTKPFQVEEVLARVNSHLSLRQQQQQISNLLQQVQQLNRSLNQRLQEQTLELRQALDYERTLKYISDRVRDSLDKTFILRAAVEELTRVLEAECCDSVVFNGDRQPDRICFQTELSRSIESHDPVAALLELPGLSSQLAQGIPSAFCQRIGDAAHRAFAMLACPIRDDRAWLGTLWLLKPLDAGFSPQEIRLVEQVANQCAIALRQARLYDEAQGQIIELHRLNQLKDNFLSTISHELRTPITNIRMVLQLLMASTEQGDAFLAQMTAPKPDNHRIVQYFRILQEECEREIALIQDLLDLQHLEAGARPFEPVTLNLNNWLLHLLEPYELRTQAQHQHLRVCLVSNPPSVTTDLSSLTRLMTELLNNACKYTPAHETIEISTEAAPTGFRIHIQNSGVEISSEEQARIFDKFYRIPSNDPWRHSGTGLGLALVRQLVDHMGATIEVASGNGCTTFSLQLPYSV